MRGDAKSESRQAFFASPSRLFVVTSEFRTLCDCPKLGVGNQNPGPNRKFGCKVTQLWTVCDLSLCFADGGSLLALRKNEISCEEES